MSRSKYILFGEIGDGGAESALAFPSTEDGFCHRIDLSLSYEPVDTGKGTAIQKLLSTLGVLSSMSLTPNFQPDPIDHS